MNGNNKYDSNEFWRRLREKLDENGLRPCPVCGGMDLMIPESMGAILITQDFSNLNNGADVPNVPVGMVYCKNCGHVEFFALGALGLLPQDK